MKMIYLSNRFLRLLAIGIACLVIGVIVAGVWLSGSIQTIAEPIFQGSEENEQVALMINVDWGEDVVPKILEGLKEKNVKATFFVTGRFAEKFPELVKEIALDGHEVENHGYTHPHPDQLSVEANQKEIEKTAEILTKITQKDTHFFAPPYGEHGENVLQAAENSGNRVIMWTLDTIDWEQPIPSHEVLVERASGEKLCGGAMILMHPKEHTAEALADIIAQIQKKGYTLVTLSEMLD